MIDLTPATERMTHLLRGLRDDQLGGPTPCPGMRIGDLVDHVGALSVAFRAAADKQVGPLTEAPPPPDMDLLGERWRQRIGDDLQALAAAWRRPGAWEGESRVGGVDLPGTVIGLVALDELVVHGWDLAVASGQPYEPPTDEVEAVIAFVADFDAPRDGSLFGPVVAVPDTAPPLDRLLGLTGRDPHWAPVRSGRA